MGFKERLKDARESKRLSQSGLGAAVDPPVSKQLVSHWEHGRHVPDLTQLLALSEFLGVTLSWLALGTSDELSPGALRLAAEYDRLTDDGREWLEATLRAARPPPRVGLSLAASQEDSGPAPGSQDAKVAASRTRSKRAERDQN